MLLPFMPLTWIRAKRQMRIAQAYGRSWLQGHRRHYSRIQIAPPPHHHHPPQFPHCWSQFQTPIPYSPNAPETNQNRRHNVQLACDRIQGLQLQPGQIFSFWHRVPRPTVAQGFRAGPAFRRGQIVQEVGGGLCLVSTNLFNSLLGAGCQVLERHNHSIDPYGDRRFFPQGQDATVYYGYKDLVLRNTSPSSLWIGLAIRVNSPEPNRGEDDGPGDHPETLALVSQIWGSAPPSHEVRIVSQVEEELPAPEPGGMPGWRVSTRRQIRCRSPRDDTPNPWHTDYETQSLYQPCGFSYYGETGGTDP